MATDPKSMKITRFGAFWKTETGTMLMWNDNEHVFQDNDTGVIYEVVERLSEDIAIVK